MPLTITGSHNGSSAGASPLNGKLFVVIGAGGAGKALAFGAKEKGARVVIANRTYGELLLQGVNVELGVNVFAYLIGSYDLEKLSLVAIRLTH